MKSITNHETETDHVEMFKDGARHFIGGTFTGSSSGKEFETINPATGACE